VRQCWRLSTSPAQSQPYAGDHHAGARHHHRQCRAALHAGQPVGVAGPDQLGADLLHRRRRDHDRASPAGSPTASAASASSSSARPASPSPPCCAGGAGHQPDGAVPPAAGRVRRRAGAAVAGGDARHLRAQERGQGDGDLGHGRDDGPDHGPVAGRLADRDLFLALGVLHQPAGRHPHRLSASDVARPRRAARLVQLGRDHHRVGHLPDRHGDVPGTLRHRPAAVHLARAVQGPQFQCRAGLHLRPRPAAAGDHGPDHPLPAEPDGLPGRHRRPGALAARPGHDGGDDGGRQAHLPGRPALADHRRPAASPPGRCG
jgi:hypothetical protein